MTIEKSATCWAKYEVLRAVDRAVAVTHVLRAALGTGRPVLGSVAASSGLEVSSPVSVPYRTKMGNKYAGQSTPKASLLSEENRGGA